MIVSLTLFLCSFVTIWMGAGLIISAVDTLSRGVHISRFLISFFLLGILTSIPEIAVGLTSVIEQRPEIFVGNLLGGIPVIFFFVIPVLAILGNGVRISHGFEKVKLLVSMGIIAAPSFFVLDGSLSNLEAIIMIGLYSSLILLFKNHPHSKKITKPKIPKNLHLGKIVLHIAIGIILVFISSHIIVNTTMQIARIFQVSSFYISLIGISLGTNLPELSLAIRSVIQKKKDIAFGDYMGSAAANTLLFGIFYLGYFRYLFVGIPTRCKVISMSFSC